VILAVNIAPDYLEPVAPEENVRLQLQHLRTHPAVASRIGSGEINLHGWIYNIETGEVTAWDDASDTFVPVEKRYASLLNAASAAA